MKNFVRIAQIEENTLPDSTQQKSWNTLKNNRCSEMNVTLETKKLAVVLQPMLAEQVVARPISLGSIFECIHELL
jgi:hypothetical protein